MKLISTFIVLLISLTYGAIAQKVAICGFNTDDQDGFSFVALDNLTGGAFIYFTDGAYVASSNSFDISGGNEALVAYTVPAGGLPVGQVITLVENANPNQNTFTITRSGGSSETGTASVSGGNFRFEAGEPFFAFSASNSSSPTTSLSQLFGYVLMGGPVSGLGDDPAADGDCPTSPQFIAVQHTSTSTDGATFDFNPGTGIRDGITLVQFLSVGNWTVSANNISLTTTAFPNLGFGGLPVEWLDFKAVSADAGVVVSWTTAYELNNDYFVVENSVDGNNFEALGKVDGAGTSDSPISYEFVDATPKADKLYYRVRQVDFDGAYSFTSVAIVNMGEMSGNTKIYPNPVVSNLSVDQFQGEMAIYNIAGQMISRTSVNGSKTIDISGLKNGIYLVKLTSLTGKVETHRIVK
ncbi:MAG: T9SS type A sorting domain-containing protein [Bacteroidia bacterium]